MQLDVAHMPVTNPEDVRLILFQSGKSSFFKVAHDIGLLCFGGIVLGMECDDARRVSPFAGVAVDQVARQIGVPRQDFGCQLSPDSLARDALPIFRIGGDLLCHEILDR